MSVLIESRQIFMSTSRTGKSRVLQPPTLRCVAHKSNEKFRGVSDGLRVGRPDIDPRDAILDLSHMIQTHLRHLSETGNVLPLWIMIAAGLRATKQVSGNPLGT
jgi:hypothetical protein